MDIRAAYDWARRLTEWLDNDITAYTIKNAVAFVIVWWLARGYFRAAAADTPSAQLASNPERQCGDRSGTDHVFQSCMSRLGRSANCDASTIGCAARAA